METRNRLTVTREEGGRGEGEKEVEVSSQGIGIILIHSQWTTIVLVVIFKEKEVSQILHI